MADDDDLNFDFEAGLEPADMGEQVRRRGSVLGGQIAV